MLSNCVKHKRDAWWLVMSSFFFTSRNDRLDKLKLKFEINIVMEKRMLDTCQ